METFLFKHTIDYSLLTNGFNIQTGMHKLVYALPGGELRHGENREIKVVINGETFTAKLCNINFDQSKYSSHKDLLQVRYSPASPIAKKLQEIFKEDFDYINNARTISGPRKQIHLPADNRDEIVFYGTTIEDTFVMECIHSDQSQPEESDIQEMNELDFENQINYQEDTSATIKTVIKTQRIRQLDRNIGESLKKIYDYRCQMTGEKIGDNYGCTVVEAHHIIPFTKSLNNNTSNIIILSPTYHRIIHKANPIFDSKTKAFVYPNGVVDKVMLNWHL